MIKTLNRTLAMATISSLGLLSPALIHAAAPSKGEIEQLKQQVQQLMQQNQQLNQRLTEMEKKDLRPGLRLLTKKSPRKRRPATNR